VQNEYTQAGQPALLRDGFRSSAFVSQSCDVGDEADLASSQSAKQGGRCFGYTSEDPGLFSDVPVHTQSLHVLSQGLPASSNSTHNVRLSMVSPSIVLTFSRYSFKMGFYRASRGCTCSGTLTAVDHLLEH